jgi:hypothetical protein
MCYLVAKKFKDVGCIALQTSHGQHLVDFKKKLIDSIDAYPKFNGVKREFEQAYQEMI